MPVSMKTEIRGLEDTRQAVREIADVGSLSAHKDAIDRALSLAAFKQNKSQGAFMGAPYAALTDRYAKRKLKRWGFTTPILIASGDGLAALVNKGNSDHILEASATRLVWGANTSLAYHQGPQRAAGLPERVVIDVAYVADEIVGIIAGDGE